MCRIGQALVIVIIVAVADFQNILVCNIYKYSSINTLNLFVHECSLEIFERFIVIFWITVFFTCS